MTDPARPPVGGAAPARRSVGGSAAWMLTGTFTLGLSGYVFLSVIGHDRFAGPVLAALTSTYLLTNIVGPGVFASIEQETSRSVSDRIQRGLAPGRTTLRIAVVAAGLAVCTLLVLAVVAPALSNRVLENDLGLLAAVALTVVGSAAVFLIRGVVGGRGQFAHYAATLLLDGGVRLVGVLALVLSGNRTPALYALVLAAGPIVASAVVGGSLYRGSSTPSKSPQADIDVPQSWLTINRSISLLMLSSVLAYGISNLAPVVVTALMPQAPIVAAGFAVGLVMTRIPLLLMAPVQAMMLPRMTRAVARHDGRQLRRDLERGLVVVAGFGTLLVAGSALLGRFGVRVLFGKSLDTSSAVVLSLLAASATLLIAIQFVQPALVALRRPGGLILGWSVGTATFLAALILLPAPPLVAAIAAQLVGPALTLLVHLSVVRHAIKRAGVSAQQPPGRALDPGPSAS